MAKPIALRLRLIPINLSRANGHTHPDLTTKKTYLISYGGVFYAGKFSREWYGLNFEGGPYDAGIQFDEPGTNQSKWQGIWEIQIRRG